MKNLDSEYFMSVTPSSTGLFRQLIVESEGKRMKMRKTAEQIFVAIKNKLGVPSIGQVLTEVCGSEESGRDKVNKVMKLFEDKVSQKADKSKDFRSFLKQQKQQVTKDTSTDDSIIWCCLPLYSYSS